LRYLCIYLYTLARTQIDFKCTHTAE